jgi:hypothetical protein
LRSVSVALVQSRKVGCDPKVLCSKSESVSQQIASDKSAVADESDLSSDTSDDEGAPVEGVLPPAVDYMANAVIDVAKDISFEDIRIAVEHVRDE